MTPNDPSAQTQAGSPAVFGNSEALLPAKGVSDNTSACKALTAPDMNGSLGVTPNDPCIHASARCAGRLTWGLGQTGLLAAAQGLRSSAASEPSHRQSRTIKHSEMDGT